MKVFRLIFITILVINMPIYVLAQESVSQNKSEQIKEKDSLKEEKRILAKEKADAQAAAKEKKLKDAELKAEQKRINNLAKA